MIKESEFSLRVAEIKSNKKGFNCVSAVLYALRCIAQEEYISPHSRLISYHLERISTLHIVEPIIIPPDAQAIGVWHKTKKFYKHLAFFDQDDPESKLLLERPQWNRALAPPIDIKLFYRRYQNQSEIYELHFLQKRSR